MHSKGTMRNVDQTVCFIYIHGHNVSGNGDGPDEGAAQPIEYAEATRVHEVWIGACHRAAPGRVDTPCHLVDGQVSQHSGRSGAEIERTQQAPVVRIEHVDVSVI